VRPATGARFEVVSPASPQWATGLFGPALQLTGNADEALEFAEFPQPDRHRAASLTIWVRRTGAGAIVSQMDESQAYRGWDVIVLADGNLEVHLVHQWPEDALAVVTQQPLPADRWVALGVTYDGSSQASGLRIYVDGVAADVRTQANSLKQEIAVDQPLRLGRRTKSLPFHGSLSRGQFFERELTADGVRAVYEADLAAAIQLDPAAATTDSAPETPLPEYYRTRVVQRDLPATKRLTELQQQREQLVREIPTAMVMKERSERRPTYLLRRGQYDQPDQTHELQPDVPSCLPPLPADAPRNRLTLARWLVDERHPLFARVVVNRLWQRFFGQGLVRSSDNFGLQGESPSHTELLDWLATELIRSGWDLQALQRLILTSATYRQTSDVAPELQSLDPENRQLARGPRFRLSAEFVRDNSLAISGLLQRRIGGPSVKPYQPAGLWDELAGGANEGPYVQSQGADLHRRSLYTYRKRTVPHPTMTTFDAPSFEICWIKRSRTNTPLQSLALLNDTTYVESARMLGQRMMTEASGSVDERLAYGFRLTTARWPSAAERALLSAAWHRYQQAFAHDPAAAAALIAHGEAPRRADLADVELASYMTVGSLLLNLDETVTKN